MKATQQIRGETAPAEPDAPAPAPPAGAHEPPAGGAAPATEPTEPDPVAVLEADLAKWRELALRTAADLENYRKRMARDRQEAVRYANQDLLEGLLPVLDNFEMGMEAAAAERGSMIYIGMEMVRRQLMDFLAGQAGYPVVAA